jgi:hypothetical protein
MLLHMVEASGPIDYTSGLPETHRCRKLMGNMFPFLDDFGHGGTAQQAGIKRLAAGGGIESRAIQVSGGPCGRYPDDPRRELTQVRIAIIEPIFHRGFQCNSAVSANIVGLAAPISNFDRLADARRRK